MVILDHNDLSFEDESERQQELDAAALPTAGPEAFSFALHGQGRAEGTPGRAAGLPAPRRPTEAEILAGALDEMQGCLQEGTGAGLDFEETRAVVRELGRLQRAAGERLRP